MSRILEAFTTLYPHQIWLEVSPDEIEKKWPSEQEYSYDVARWNAFLNRLTLDVFLRWIEEESGIEEQPEVWPSLEDLPSIWEVVNGTAIKLGGTRIVLIPSGETDTNEFCVPAEWVDIPSWAADYYLAVQVNPDDCWLRVWGYTTHKKLRQVGQYNNIRRTYSLEREELIEDLNVMWVARKLGRDRKAAVDPLPTLSPAQAENLLERLSQPSSYSPRLKIDFAQQWGAFIENETLRQRLYKQRIEQEPVAPVAAVATRWVNLSQWLENIFESGWQALEDLLSSRTTPGLNYRSTVRFLNKTPEELIRIIQTTQSKEERWQAAESLWQRDSDNPAGGVRKAIDLSMQLAGHPIALMVVVLKKSDQEVAVFVRVFPMNGETQLPPGLELIITDEAGNSRSAVAKKDIYIQHNFTAALGEKFSFRVALGNASTEE